MKPSLLLCLLLATGSGCTRAPGEPNTPTEKALAAFLEETHPDYKPEHFFLSVRFTAADSLALLRKAAEASASTLTIEEQQQAIPVGRKARIAANRAALERAFSSDTTTLGTALWHRYTYRTAQGTKAESRCYVVYKSGRISMVDSVMYVEVPK
jgi:hypothetical protein